MTLRSKIDCAWLVLATALTRYLTRSRFLYDLDSVNFALALDHLDPAAHQPHPPGYFLYVLLGRAARALTASDSNIALVGISIAASCGAVILIYMLARDWFGRLPALLAGVFFVCSPLCWFHGTVALTYIVEAFFSALIGILCWRAYKGSFPYAMAAAIVVGVAAGFRPSSALFLILLWLFSTFRFGWRGLGRGLLAITATCAAWFIPMLAQSGGPGKYFGALWDLWTIVPGAVSAGSSGAFLSFARALTAGFILFLCFGAATLLFGLRTRTRLSIEQRKFIAIWVTPPLLFFTLIFLKFVNSGYLLIITPPLFAMLGNRAATWYRGGKHWFPQAALAASLAVNILIYIYAPLYCSYREVRRFERDLVRACARVRSIADPRSSIVVGFDSHFLGYRHAAYYLPEFTVFQYPEVKYVSGTRLFVATARRTSVIKSMDLSGYRNVVFFPLPEGPEYIAYFNRMADSLPPGVVVSRDCEYGKAATAPLFSLRRLFSETVGQEPYTGGYTAASDGN